MPAIGTRQPDPHFRLALGIALGVHMLLLGISFSTDTDERRYNPQIDVTLARQPTELAPDRATHIAQANQQGSGNEADRNEVSSRAIPSLANPRGASESLSPQRDTQPRQARDKPLNTTAEARAQVLARQEEGSRDPTTLRGVNPEVDALSRELAGLQAELDEQSRAYAEMPRVRRLTSLATRSSVDAAYLEDWRRRVEVVGNRYYPEASVRYGIYGSLRLLVVIDHSGQLKDIRVLSSSGYAMLDEAAIKIVRMAAPYAPFPPELRATTDQLEIIRTWQFQQNRLSSG